MLGSYARAAMLGLALWAVAAPAVADDLADFNGLTEAAEAHARVAIGYLRTGNTDLAAIEVDRLRAAWSKLTDRFAGNRPAIFDGNALYGMTLTEVGVRLVAADLMLNSGRLEKAAEALNAMRANLYILRKSAGIVVLADCIRDSTVALDALMAFDKATLDWTNPQISTGVARKAAGYGQVIERCDKTASDALRKEPEFRRLIDGAKEGLVLIPQAVQTRDTNLLHRVLIQLRSFDHLLTFRFG